MCGRSNSKHPKPIGNALGRREGGGRVMGHCHHSCIPIVSGEEATIGTTGLYRIIRGCEMGVASSGPGDPATQDGQSQLDGLDFTGVCFKSIAVAVRASHADERTESWWGCRPTRMLSARRLQFLVVRIGYWCCVADTRATEGTSSGVGDGEG